MPIELRNVSVLIVDDNKHIRDILVFILEGLGVGKISVAANAQNGFDKFKREKPDIVFLDWDMEPVSGLELSKKIRQDLDSTNRQVPIIMLTGYSAFFRVLQARESGVTEFMTKPFTAETIAKRISYVINNPRDFIKHPEFVGPDRRRKKTEGFVKKDRRKRE